MPAGPSPNDTNETIRGTYSMHARDISLICDEQPAEGIPARDGGTRVAIRSHGGGLSAADGRIWIDATGTAAITCDTAILGIRRAGGKQEILAETDPTGTITLRQATPVLSPHIKLDDQGIELGVGPEGVGARIKLTAQGITLSFGISKMEFGPTGIKMTVAEVNTLELAATGFEVNALMAALKSMVNTDIQGGVMTTVQASALLKESAALVTIGP
ncbi:hypothetical protein TA3x_003320 [Tundrisphaera sp. TA3]|uniref:hypothetical protein n=1 Tax=Tundrisphaera sp. TA3 TaxID=3435775 RepID=UPI003EBB37FC